MRTDEATNAAKIWRHEAGLRLEGLRLRAFGEELGVVRSVADDVAIVAGLSSVRLNELLRFDDGTMGFAQVLERDHIGCILLDNQGHVNAGMTVRGTGEVIRVPVGAALLGRVVDPLGRPLDGLGPIMADRTEPIERAAPEIIDRAEVTQPVQTGILAIDALFALGRGQRELIIGDRATGKTAIAVDTIVAQKSTDLICVYVAIGQKSAGVKRVIDAIQSRGDMSRVIVVVAEAASAPGLQWIAPFAGIAMAEYFRDAGQHALIVLDDLSKHADCHREIALLTGQPAGREAYPGDIFYLHARLLERAAKLSDTKGGGSLTALPIAETDAGNLSAYIPTNLISITDGQIVLDARLFNEGHKPAVNVGTSVSRVGGKTQAKALRQATDTLRLDYAQFLELEIFARFGSVADERVRRQLRRGDRIRQVLTQPQYRPLPLVDEVLLLLALQAGLLDGLTPDGLRTFREGATAACRDRAQQAIAALSQPVALGQDDRQRLIDVLGSFAASLATDGETAT